MSVRRAVRRRRPDRRPRSEATAPDDPDAARLAALKLLNRRDYCAAELSGRLAERGFEAGVAHATVARLERERLVDDERFAEHYVRAHAERGQGPVRIAHELKELGVAQDLVERAVDASDGRWRERCVALRRRRFGEQPPSEWKERGRQARFLTYRGFSAEQVRAALGNDIGLDE